jgi:small-conductance mechanosensitive channel
MAPRVVQTLVQRQHSQRLVRFVQDAGPAIAASTLMAIVLGTGLALSVPLYEQIVVWKVLSLTVWVLGVRVLSWLLRVVMNPHGLLRFLLRCIEWGVMLTMVLTFFGLLQPVMDMVASVQFSVGSQVFKGANIVGGVMMAVLALTIAGQLTQFIEWGLTRYSARQQILTNDALILSRLLGLTIFVLTAIGVLVGSGIDAATLTAFGGALGIGLGFGLQEVVVNFVSGVFLLFERAVKPGDYVTVGNITGQVVELGHRSLIIRDAVGTENLIPNTTLSRGVVQNHTLSSDEFRISFVLRLAHIAQYEPARALIEQAMRQHPRVLKDRPLGCLVTGLYADEATLELSCWINDLHNGQKGLVSDLLLVMGLSLKEQGITLANSQRAA